MKIYSHNQPARAADEHHMPNPEDLDWHPPDWRRKPPGMIWEDWQAWDPWLAGPGRTWTRYTYDLELLTQPIPTGERDPAMLKMWLRSTARRIDAVGWRNNRYDLFEARRIAGWSAIAQLVGYRDLWLIQYPNAPLGDLYLIVERADDAIRAAARRQNLHTWAVGEKTAA